MSLSLMAARSAKRCVMHAHAAADALTLLDHVGHALLAAIGNGQDGEVGEAIGLHHLARIPSNKSLVIEEQLVRNALEFAEFVGPARVPAALRFCAREE